MRIVAGTLRGRLVPVPPGEVRPTAQRVREALMSILGPEWEGRRVLDGFCGSGAFGFEAVSRGAEHATLIDDNARVLRQVDATARAFGVTAQVRTLRGDVAHVLEQLAKAGERFDIVFLDPPYAPNGPLDSALAGVAKVLGTYGTVVAEHPDGTPPVDPPTLRVTGQRRYGDTALRFYQHAPGAL